MRHDPQTTPIPERKNSGPHRAITPDANDAFHTLLNSPFFQQLDPAGKLALLDFLEG